MTNNAINTPLITLANTFTTSGNFPLTLTQTGSTSVTLPTSGTLVSSVTTANGVSASNTAGALTFTLGAITPTTVNKLTITAPATGSTLTIADGKTLTVSNTLTFTGTDSSSVAFGTGGTVLYGNQTITLSGDVTGSGSTAITTTVAKIAGTTVSGTTGSGNVVFSTSPTLTTAVLGSSTATTQSPADNSTKLATTAYVDAAILGQNFKEAAKYATTAALPSVVYANGSSGVGATLTGVALAAISVDSASPGVGDRILVKNQVSSFQNGIYLVTQTGSGIAVFILTRTTDANQTGEFKTGDSIFITNGTVNSSTTWAYTGIDSPTIGTDAITYAQTAGQGTVTAGNGIIVTGLSVAIDTSITVDKTTAQALTNKDLTGAGNTFPTFNQNTTGSAAKLTTARTIAGTSFDGSANISLANKFIVQGTADSGLSAAQFLGSLATGIVKNTTTTGVLSIAVNTDLPVGDATHSGAVPTPPNNTTTFLRGDMTFATPVATTPTEMIWSTVFETAGRYTTGGNAPTFGTPGVTIATTATSGSTSEVQWALTSQNNGALYGGSPQISIAVDSIDPTKTGIIFLGIGFPKSGGTYLNTAKHVGFAITITGGVATINGTQADGTTENATASLGTIVAADEVELIAKINSTTSVTYYVRKNAGTLSAGTTATGNVPSGSEKVTSFFSDNQVNNNAVTAKVSGATYRR